jgi:hypothetical protein
VVEDSDDEAVPWIQPLRVPDQDPYFEDPYNPDPYG